MKTEEQVLNDLMKKTQTERFKENKISGLVYNIRMKKYEEKLQQIKEELPVVEERLKNCMIKFRLGERFIKYNVLWKIQNNCYLFHTKYESQRDYSKLEGI